MPDNERDPIADTATFRAFFEQDTEQVGRTLSPPALALVLFLVVATVALVAWLLL